MRESDENKEFRYPIVFGAKYIFKCLDIVFKVLGWLLFVIAFRVVSTKVDSSLLRFTANSLSFIYFLAIPLFCFALMTASREEIGLGTNRTGLILAIFVKTLALAVVLTLSNPRFPVDHIVDRIMELQITK